MLKIFTCLWMGFFISLTHCQDCKSGMPTDVLSCFTNEGISTKNLSGLDAQTLLKQAANIDPNIMCIALTSFKNAMNCTMSLLKSCLMPLDLGFIVPDIQLMNQGFDYLCSNLNNFDVTCIVEKRSAVSQCGTTVFMEVMKRHPEVLNMTTIEALCLANDINYDCISVHMSNCPKSTSQIYLDLVDKYLLPSACINKNPSRAGRQSYKDLVSSARGHHSHHCYFILLVVIFSLLFLI